MDGLGGWGVDGGGIRRVRFQSLSVSFRVCCRSPTRRKRLARTLRDYLPDEFRGTCVVQAGKDGTRYAVVSNRVQTSLSLFVSTVEEALLQTRLIVFCSTLLAAVTGEMASLVTKSSGEQELTGT